MPADAAPHDRIPPITDGMQVNFCKNPACANFGVPAASESPRGRPRLDATPALYTITYGSTRTVPQLWCRVCGERPPVKSNLAIAEERSRFLKALDPPAPVTCPNSACASHGRPVTDPTIFWAFGRTRSGSPRYRCKICKRTVAIGTATTGQKAPHKNREIFSLLMNKSPFRRICEVADIHPATLYGKIAFLAAQCAKFIADREAALRRGLPMKRLYLGTDRQEYLVNWTRHEDRRNVRLHAVGTADNTTGDVFGLHVNFDPDMDQAVANANAEASADANQHPPFRRHARVWLASDYTEALQRRVDRANRKGTLRERIEATYGEANAREDVEVFESADRTQQLPTQGMQVHAEYTLYGHFFFLRELFKGAEKIRFFLDQDSGIRAACLSAFQPEIAARTADAFYVRINGELTVVERQAAIAKSRKVFHTARAAHPDLTENEVKLLLIKGQMATMAKLGKWQDRWLVHPFPHMSEPEKAVCYLTDYREYDEDHRA